LDLLLNIPWINRGSVFAAKDGQDGRNNVDVNNTIKSTAEVSSLILSLSSQFYNGIVMYSTSVCWHTKMAIVWTSYSRYDHDTGVGKK